MEWLFIKTFIFILVFGTILGAITYLIFENDNKGSK